MRTGRKSATVGRYEVLAGYLFAYAVAGPDPAPHRPSVPARLWILGVAVAGHAVLAQLLHADMFVRVPASAADLQGGASLMYFGGDVAELLLALALVSTWRPRREARSVSRRAARLPLPAAAGRPSVRALRSVVEP